MKKIKDFARAKFEKKAEKISKNTEELDSLVSKASEKISNRNTKDRLGEAFGILGDFLRLIRAYIKGDYRKVSMGSLISIVIAILYFLNPMDLIPDFIFAIGLLDDISVIMWTGNKMMKELQEFKEWESSNNSR